MASPPPSLSVAFADDPDKFIVPRHSHRHPHQWSLRPLLPSAPSAGGALMRGPSRGYVSDEGDPPSPTSISADVRAEGGPSSVALPAGFPSHITMNVNITTTGMSRSVVNSAQLVYDHRRHPPPVGAPSAPAPTSSSASVAPVLVPIPSTANKKRKSSHGKKSKDKDFAAGNNGNNKYHHPHPHYGHHHPDALMDVAAYAVPVAMAASPSSSASPSSASSSASSSSSSSASSSASALAPLPVPMAAAKSSPFEKLNTLKLLLDCGHLTEDEYQERKTQIINEMTGTSTERKKPPPSTRRHPQAGVGVGAGTGGTGPPGGIGIGIGIGSSPGPGLGLGPSATSSLLPPPPPPPPLQPIMKTVVPHHPPDFGRIRRERADKLSFDVDTLEWKSAATRVKIDLVPFATGQLRNAYYLQELGVEGMVAVDPPKLLVAKFSIRHAEPSSYLSDVEMQAVCAHYAALYNEHEPPLKVYYARSWLLKLRDRGDLVCSVEEYLPGSYVKYSNNNGYVGRETSTTEERERNTPQAFSHFSFVASDYRLMIVDIQGVDDSYTDPQIHTADGRGFGAGNLGTLGMEKFLESHRCNEVCRWLGLRSINEQYKPGGTAAPKYQMPFGGAIKKSTNRITEERNTFSTSVTVSEAFGDGLTGAAAAQDAPFHLMYPQPPQQQQQESALRHYERARGAMSGESGSGGKDAPLVVQAARGLGLPLKHKAMAAGGGGARERPSRGTRSHWWELLKRLLCWCYAA